MNSGRGKTIDNFSSIACSSPLRHDHLDPVSGAKGHAGKGRDDGVGGETEAESPGDRRQQQGRLQQGEVVANANSRTTAEGEVGVAVNLLLEAKSPALGAERFRLVEPAWVAVGGWGFPSTGIRSPSTSSARGPGRATPCFPARCARRGSWRCERDGKAQSFRRTLALARCKVAVDGYSLSHRICCAGLGGVA